MKKILFSLILFFICINTFAQTTEYYRNFLGIPIEGSGESLANSLSNNGFRITGRNNEVGKIFLSGKYDELDCDIEIQHVAHLNEVISLQVNFVTDTTSITSKEKALVKKIFENSIAPYKNKKEYEIVGTLEDISQFDTLDMFFTTLNKRFSDEFTFPCLAITLSHQQFSIFYTNVELFYQLHNFTTDYLKTRDTYYFKGIPIEGDTKTFAQKLITQGYKLNNSTTLYDDIIWLEGKFFGEDVTINIERGYSGEIKFIAVSFLQERYLSEHRPALYRRIKNSLIEKYPQEDGWDYMEEDEDISILSDKEMYRKVSIYDKTYMFRIFDNPNVHTSPYIALVLSKDSLLLFYQNPNTIQQIKSQESDDL